MTVSSIRLAVLVAFPLAGGLGACTQDLEQDTSQVLADDEAAHVRHGCVLVTYTGNQLPAEIAGKYDEAFDCTRDEGGAWFGGVDFTHCFRKSDGSAWRIWNTGCGWEYGLQVPFPGPHPTTMWERFARTYSGLCSEIPRKQLGVHALTTSTFFDGFGEPIEDLTSRYRPTMASCR